MDSSNKKNIYNRNLLRNKKIPEIEKINPQFVEAISNLSKNVNNLDENVESQKKRIIIKTKVKFSSIPPTKPNFYKSKILRTNEVKIKKIVKQPTEKRNYKIKDYVVYPKHGVGKIISIERTKIGILDINFYKVFIEKE